MIKRRNKFTHKWKYSISRENLQYNPNIAKSNIENGHSVLKMFTCSRINNFPMKISTSCLVFIIRNIDDFLEASEWGFHRRFTTKKMSFCFHSTLQLNVTQKKTQEEKINIFYQYAEDSGCTNFNWLEASNNLSSWRFLQ